MKRLILALAVFSVSLSFVAAESGTAVIVYAEGDEVSVIRDKREMKVADPIGFVIEAGDIVQTGKNTVIEMSVKPKKSVIRMSGNTTLEFRGSYRTGETSLAVIYGRVRAKVEKLVGTERFSLRNEGTVAGVRGTDFGMDVIISKDAELGESKVSVFCFEGSLLVDTALDADSPVQASGLIKSGEMIESVVKGEEVSLVTAPLPEDLREFWDANAFKSEDASSIVVQAPLPETPAADAVKESLPAEGTAVAEALKPELGDAAAAPFEAPKLDWAIDKKRLGIKNGMLGTSSLLVAAGAGLGIYNAYRLVIQEDDTYSDILLLSGAVCTTTGFMLGLFGLLFNPNIPPR